MKKKSKGKKKKTDGANLTRSLKYNINKLLIPLIILMTIAVLILVFHEMFKVERVVVEGSSHYTTDEITNYVLDSPLCRNTVFVNLIYKNKTIKDVPFVQQMDVSIVDRNTVKIHVYEKTVAGSIYNLGNYLYFDNDGIIVEVSKIKTENLPVITGLTFDHFELHEPLPVDNPEVFDRILNITKLLNKNELNADIIFFDEYMNVTLFFGEARISIGTANMAEEQFDALRRILPSLEGKKGVLHMEKYSKKNNNVVFEEDVD